MYWGGQRLGYKPNVGSITPNGSMVLQPLPEVAGHDSQIAVFNRRKGSETSQRSGV